MGPDREQPVERLTGSVERIVFHNEDNGFSVLAVRLCGRREPVTVVGTLPEVREGEWLDAEGRWHVDKRHGRQFRAQSLRIAVPNTPAGIRRYLASGLIDGIGATLADRLVEKFGPDVLEVIQTAPRKLLRVKGIGKVRLERIRRAWGEQKSVRDILLFLHSHGVSTGRAFRIYKKYGDRAIELLRADPYRLARDIRGIGFQTADRIAERIGIDRHSPIRARAGVEYALRELTADGHCAYPRDELVAKCAEMLAIPPEVVDAALVEAVAAGRLVGARPADGRELVYLAALHHAEVALAEDLAALAAGPHPCPKIDAGKAIRWVEKRIGLVLADQQRKAVELATRAKVMVVTGGPGVGKTTLVDAILKVLRAKKLKAILCAPTGRAAKRLGEATGLEAKTIHRTLAYSPVAGGFRHNAEDPLEGDVVVIDETSMLDLPLAHHVVRAVPPHASLILVGDVDQLPSVGPGCVLRDVIDSGTVPVCRLTEVFRQAARSAIITNAHRINHGRMPLFPPPEKRGRESFPRRPAPTGRGRDRAEKTPVPFSGAGRTAPAGALTDFYFCRADRPEKAVELILRMVRQRIPERFGFHPIDEIQVISPMRRGVLGTRNLNELLQRELNPTGDSYESFGRTYRVGDKVMQTVNNYDKDVFNGDIGRIAAIDTAGRQLTVRFDGRPVKYALGELDELALSYAITVHKSQGTEYPVVIVPVHTQHFVMLQRNLLYTAITRSRKLVVLVGTERAIGLAVQRASSRRRITTLRERLLRAGRGGAAGGRLPFDGPARPESR